MTRARSLSRLANTNAFTVDASQNVGIGSTQPDVRLDVNGDMNVTGTLTYEDVTNVETAGITTTGGLVVTGLGATIGGITTFFGDLNFGAAGVGGTITPLGHAEFVGVVTASSFSGDGSGLTGVASTDNINTSTLAQFTGGVGIADSIFHIGDDNTAIRFPGSDTFTVTTSGSEALRVDGQQRLILGATSAIDTGTTSLIQAVNAGGARIVLARNDTSTAQNDSIGRIRFYGNDSDGNYDECARLDVIADADHTSTSKASALTVHTTASGAESPTERLRITSGGALLIAKTTTSITTQGSRLDNGLITVSGDSSSTNLATNSGGVLNLANADSTDNNFSNIGGYNSNGLVVSQIDFINKSHSSRTGEIAFLTHNGSAMSERLRIGSSGQIGLGGANYGTSGQVLTSNGSGSAVTWEDASGGGGITTQVGNASGIVTSMFLTDATDHKVTATGICTITTTQAGTEGQSHTIRIVNSGIATVGFSTYFLFPSGAAPVLPTADGAVSLISFTVHDSVGAGCTQLLAGASVNFS